MITAEREWLTWNRGDRHAATPIRMGGAKLGCSDVLATNRLLTIIFH